MPYQKLHKHLIVDGNKPLPTGHILRVDVLHTNKNKSVIAYLHFYLQLH